MFHPAGFALPPLPYLVAILFAATVVGALLLAFRPPVTKWTVVALAPWMVAGAALRVLDELGSLPELVAPLFGAPAVYVSTFSVAGAVWVTAVLLAAGGLLRSPARLLGSAGTLVAILTFLAVLWQGYVAGTLVPFWPVMAFVAAGVVAAVAFALLSIYYTDAVAVTGKVGLLVVFAHALDGISTAVGVDVLGAGEQTPASRAILEFAGQLPTAETIGSGWLFVLVKLVLALVVVLLTADYVREEPSRGNLLLAFVAAVGLGPGVHNLLLFLVAG